MQAICILSLLYYKTYGCLRNIIRTWAENKTILLIALNMSKTWWSVKSFGNFDCQTKPDDDYALVMHVFLKQNKFELWPSIGIEKPWLYIFKNCNPYLQGKNLFVNAKEICHGLRPRTESCHISTHFFGRLKVIIFHIQVWL